MYAIMSFSPRNDRIALPSILKCLNLGLRLLTSCCAEKNL